MMSLTTSVAPLGRLAETTITLTYADMMELADLIRAELADMGAIDPDIIRTADIAYAVDATARELYERYIGK